MRLQDIAPPWRRIMATCGEDVVKCGDVIVSMWTSGAVGSDVVAPASLPGGRGSGGVRNYDLRLYDLGDF